MTQRYDTYKDSGVQWLGDIPGHWGCVPLKYFIETKSGTAINVKELDDKGTYPVYGGGSQIGFCNKYNCEETEIIVGRVGAKCGCVTFPNKKVWATDNALIIKTNLYPRFTAFVLVAADLNRLNAANAQPLITGTKIKHVRIALPPLSEQRSIVSFLDAKCGKIDEWVTKKQKEVEHLQELKQRVIADAVTRGLNPNVKMKATNILWIKEIPEHWEIKRLKYLVSCNDESLTNTENPNLEINYVEIGDVNDINGIAHITKYRFEDAPSRARRKTRKDDVIVSTVRTYLKAIAKVPDNGIIVSTGFAVLRAIDVNSSYLAFCCISSNFIDSVVALSKGISYPAITASELLNLFIPVPPLSEQKQIVSYLDTKCSKIEKLIANINKEIERIKEYKQRLISDVVTGQIKVNQ